MTRSRAFAVIAIAAGVGFPLAWGAGELHYRNCVNTAPDRAHGPAVDFAPFGEETGTEKQIHALRRGCSRLPF